MRSQVEMDRLRVRLENDYMPLEVSSGSLDMDVRLRQADALEYIAFHVGQISKKLDGLTAKSAGESS
jgi:hypothetical protein